jgi:hypothetical protein|tara:strand:+ start:40 stop:558 length:519 start_codon:yes stop_codon:yes gene_type:complete
MANYSKKTSSGSSKTLMSGKAPISPLINNMSSRAPRNTILSPLGENSNLRREAFNRKQFDDTINTNFTELGVNTVDPSTFDPSLATVGDFFTIYQTLFYQIPKLGDVNSHEFLIKESTEYTQFVAQQEEIDALLAEIDELRAQNVKLVADMTNTITNLEEAFVAAQANNNAG